MAGVSLYISVGKSKQIVTGLQPETLVGEVVAWLTRRNSLLERHVLVEVWRGCSRPLDPRERLSDSYSNWGTESRHVTLKLVNHKVFRKFNWKSERSRLRKRILIKKNQCRGLNSGGSRVSSRHSLKFKKGRHKNLMKRRLEFTMHKLTNQVKEMKLRMKEEDTTVMTTKEKKNEADHFVSFLNPYLQGEYISAKGNVTKAKQMKKELQRHKKELEQNLHNRQSEILSLETNVEGTQEKVDHERTVLARQPLNLQDNPEYKQVTQKLEDLNNHLRAKQKISQVQSLKMQDLITEKNKLERLIHICKEEIKMLRSQMYTSKEEEDREMV